MTEDIITVIALEEKLEELQEKYDRLVKALEMDCNYCKHYNPGNCPECGVGFVCELSMTCTGAGNLPTWELKEL